MNRAQRFSTIFSSKTIFWPLFFLLMLSLPFCAPKSPKDFGTAAEVYDYGLKLYQNEDYGDALKFFEEIQQSYPLSQHLAQATYYAGVCHFEQGEEIEAVAGFDNFLRLYPNHQLAPDARFFQARAYQEQVPSTIDRDQSNTVQALKVYEQYISLHGQGAQLAEAKKQVLELKLQLARREIYVARYYLRQKKYDSALGRLLYLQKNYPGLPLEGEDLYYLGLTYYKKKETELARETLSGLLDAHKKGPFTDDARKILERLQPKRG